MTSRDHTWTRCDTSFWHCEHCRVAGGVDEHPQSPTGIPCADQRALFIAAITEDELSSCRHCGGYQIDHPAGKCLYQATDFKASFCDVCLAQYDRGDDHRCT